jgi:Pretoxin HINT domain
MLAYVPLLGAAGGVKKFFAANKAAKADDVVKAATSNTVTKTGNCFVAGTEILTSEGEKKIEDIQVGDWVVADDPNTVGEIEYKQVLDTFVRHTDKLVDLYIDGEVTSTTGEHPFWTPDKGWVEAKDLVVGSLVQTEDGRIIDVDRVEKREGDFTVYNFKVEGFHTYFVSDLGILVHNANCKIITLGIEDHLDDFTKQMDGNSWKNWAKDDADNWKSYFLDKVSHPDNQVKFNLDGVDVWGGVQRSSSGRGGATDWELLQIRSNPEWWNRIEFYKNGELVPNPFQ